MRMSQRMVLQYIKTKFTILSIVSKRAAAEKAFDLFCTPQYRNKKKLPRIFEQAESLQFEFEGSSIQGYRWNAASEKKILILHGFESSIVNFDRYINPLIKKGYCVLGFDAPAHGRSAGTKITVLVYRRFINFIQKQYGPIKDFMGHSLGGFAISLSLEEWKNTADYKIVLIAPATETTTAIDTFFSFLNLPQRLRPEFDKCVLRMGGQPPEWFSIKRAAPYIQAQVLWFHDKDDDMTPLKDVQPIIEKNYPNFRFVITEGLGHRRIYRDNKVSKAIIDFFT